MKQPVTFRMPLNYNLKDKNAPLSGMELHQIDMMRFHMGKDRNTGIEVYHKIVLKYYMLLFKGPKKQGYSRSNKYWN